MGRRRKADVKPGFAGGGETDVDRDPLWVERVRAHLVAWYGEAGRDLPWRGDADPYRVLVSEMMLVQTTVAAVIPYFERFLRRFPTVRALAAASEDQVLKAWEGLGYYRRARQLHAAGRMVVERHGGVFPDEPEAIRALPGVGRYIAGAILSFAFDRPAPILEANTQRVLARWLAWRGDLKASATQSRLWEAAERLVPPEGAGRFNQAFMDLGALICTPRTPRCLVCPLAGECQARAHGLQDELPVTTPKPPPREVVEACALIHRGGRLLVLKRGPGRLWAGFWEFPTVHVSGADPGGRSAEQGGAVDLATGVARMTGLAIQVAAKPVLSVDYTVTRHRVRLNAFEADARGESLTLVPGFVEGAWIAPGELAALHFSAAGRRLVAWVSRCETGGGSSPV